MMTSPASNDNSGTLKKFCLEDSEISENLLITRSTIHQEANKMLTQHTTLEYLNTKC